MNADFSRDEKTLAPALPAIEPATSPELEEIIEAESTNGLAGEIDPESIVEAAELLLREGAPHDFDVLVIGAGPGGLACATHLAQSGQTVALVERDEIGGVCLNRGCIPTKTLLESVGALRLMRRAEAFGIHCNGTFSPDIAAIQERKRKVVADLRAQSEQLAEESGVQILRGMARFADAHTIELEAAGQVRRLSAVHVVIATGGKPTKLPIEGRDLGGVITSDEILEMEIAPRQLIIVGAGAVGVEFAAIWAELGSSVTLLEKAGAVLPGEDKDIQREMASSLESSGIEVRTGVQIERIEASEHGLRVVCDGDQSLEAEIVLMASGRKSNIEDLDLGKAGVEVRDGKIGVDDNHETNVSGVWAIGDCIRRVGWAHQAALEGRRVADSILGVQSAIDARFVPSCYYTFPEVASVGLTLETAQELGIDARVGKCAFRSNGRANTSGDNGGFVKLVVENRTGKLLGAQIIGPRATELINEIALALRDGDTAEHLADSLHAHPTFAEVLPGAARAALR